MNNSSLDLSRDFLYHPESASSCTTYSIWFSKDARKKRLNKMGLTLHLHNRPRGQFPDGIVLRQQSANRLTDELCCFTSALERTVESPSGTLFTSETPQLYYVNVTSDSEGKDIGNAKYSCPNCGYVSLVSDLLNGCAYCHSRFELSELYPRITETFLVTDHGITKTEFKSSAGKSVAIGAIVGAAFGVLTLFFASADGAVSFLSRFLTGALLGMIISYFVWSFKKAGAVIKDAAATIPLISKQKQSQRFFNEFNERYPETSQERFAGDIYSLLESVIFSEDCTNIPYYTGKRIDLFDNVADCTFRGALEIADYRFEGSLCSVWLNVFLTTYRFSSGHITSQQECVSVAVKKDFSNSEDSGFTAHVINCDHCGASFDSLRVKNCPYCGNSYKKETSGWIITSVSN